MSPFKTFQRLPSKTTGSCLYCLKRLFWASMLIMHAAPIHAVTLQAMNASQGSFFAESLWSLLGLGLSAILFVLKVADVSWLRRNPGMRSALASTLVVALIHVGVIEHSSTADKFSPIAPIGVTIVATILADAPRTFRRSVRASWLRITQHCGEKFSLLTLRTWRGWINDCFRQCLSWFRASMPARAPPCAMSV